MAWHGIMALSLSEIPVLLEQKISNSYSELNIDEIGRVLCIGDGIARVYGLNKFNPERWWNFQVELDTTHCADQPTLDQTMVQQAATH